MKIIGAGLVTVDIIQPSDSVFRPVQRHRAAYASGGTVCNILCYLAAFNWHCHIIGRVGTDEMADVVIRDLRGFGIDTVGVLPKKDVSTRRFAHLIAVDGTHKGQHTFAERCFHCAKEFTAVRPPRIEEVEGLAVLEDLSDCALLIDRANELTLRLAQRTARAGGVVIFEPGYLSRDREVVYEILKYVDVLKYSEELRWHNRRFSEQIPLEPPRLKLIIQTRSAKGVRVSRANTEFKITTTPITTWVDRAGAGDAFMAGFLTGLGPEGIRDVSALTADVIEAAIQRGQAFGGLACLFLGSKGLLYSKSVKEIEAAVDHTIRTLRAPDDFGEDVLAEGIPLRPPRGASCEVCRLG